MTRVKTFSASAPLVVLTALLLSVTSVATAQSDAISFEIETYRVDLVREDGEIVERFVPVDEAIPGEEIEYRVTARHDGNVIIRPGLFAVTIPIGDDVAYLDDSATPSNDRILTEFSADGGETYAEPGTVFHSEEEGGGVAAPEEYTHVRWTLLTLFEPDQEETFVYRVTVR